jgi:SAM-dependent methyltransferase
MTEPSSLEPSIALAAYAEPLASNRRVLVFGNALASLSLQLLERGARSVHVCDADAVRASEASARNRSTQISFSSLAESDLSLRDGSFELTLVDNLGAFNALALLRTAKRALSSRGVAVIACPNPEAAFPLLRSNAPGATSLDYYALYDAVAAEFEHVRMLGQTPFVGYAIADFSASGEPEPALDTSFVPGGAEEPDSFIALASNQEVRLDEFAVIQLPTRRMLGSIGLKAEAPAAPASTTKDAELARLNQWLKELESRASTADERADHAETELEELRPQLDTERQAHVSLKAQHDGLKAQHDGLKAQHDKEVSGLRAELSALRTQASNLRAESSRLPRPTKARSWPSSSANSSSVAVSCVGWSRTYAPPNARGVSWYASLRAEAASRLARGAPSSSGPSPSEKPICKPPPGPSRACRCGSSSPESRRSRPAASAARVLLSKARSLTKKRVDRPIGSLTLPTIFRLRQHPA